MLAVLLLGLWLTMIAAPGTPVGTMLQRWLVAKPAAALSRVHRGAVLVVLVMAALASIAFLIMGHDGIQLFGLAAPELGTMLAMVDLGVVLDVTVLAIAAVASGSLRGVRAVLPRMRPRARTVRSRRVRRADKPAANDDSDGRGWVLAA